jgi:hypothetical protein
VWTLKLAGNQGFFVQIRVGRVLEIPIFSSTQAYMPGINRRKCFCRWVRTVHIEPQCLTFYILIFAWLARCPKRNGSIA